ncbi:MAG: SRPBCC family protein [Planctomycetes bacterium]|nr:SRPBCC family protein [Planctomycetota bacterium]
MVLAESDTVPVPVDYAGGILVGAPIEEAYGLVSDCPRSASHFPGLESFTRVEGRRGEVYEWVNEESRLGAFHFRVRYQARFHKKRPREVAWESVPGQGSVDVRGRWTLAREGEGTRLDFSMEVVLHLRIPRLARGVARRVIRARMQAPMREYLENIRAALGPA